MKRLLLSLVVAALLLTAASPVFADTTYVVQTGDNLFRISLKFGVSIQAIMAANGLSNPNLIAVGQRLVIPTGGGSPAPTQPPSSGGSPAPTATPAPGLLPGRIYIVQSGDWLTKISRRFGVSVALIKLANGLVSDTLFIGQQLVIPDPNAPVPTPPPATQPPSSGGSPAPTATPAPAGTPELLPGRIYVVRVGDWLSRIATRFGVSMQAIMTANGITDPNRIFVGQQLVIPDPNAPAPTPPPAATTTTTPAPPPPSSGGSFELGGQVSSFGAPDKMKYAGMAWVKRQLKWYPGMAASADMISDAHARGFKILLSVLGNPGDISGGANYDSYAAFVADLAGFGADAIEVWNEMNLDREWPAGQISPTSYVDLLRRSYTAIKARNSRTLVISGAPSPTGAEGAFGLDRVWNDDRYIRGMAAAGAASYMDCIGVHYNEGIISPTQSSGDPRDGYYTRYYSGMVSMYYNAFGGARKLCFTELGYLSPEGYGPLPGAFGWAGNTTVAQQAQWLGEAVTLARNSGLVRLFIVFNVDFTLYGDDPQGGYAIIRPGGGCPACDTLHGITGGR